MNKYAQSEQINSFYYCYCHNHYH